MTSEGDYEWRIPVLVGDNAVPTGDLYDPYERSFAFDGKSGVALTPGNVNQLVGASGKGLTIALWFRLQATFSAVNQGHNTLFAISNSAGTTIKVVITAGRPVPRLSKPRLLILITTRNNVIDGSDFVSDYGASETDKPGGHSGVALQRQAKWRCRGFHDLRLERCVAARGAHIRRHGQA